MGQSFQKKWDQKDLVMIRSFLPDGYSKSFAQMNLEEKNKISHRSLAINKLVSFLNDL